ncbi:MAG TPA: Crp/Fnr family transcriptional regulator [Azospirillaceae bacterium]|nr:Crp/Fnr family transcriptional regulator [Azospirillaceae bacterium]
MPPFPIHTLAERRLRLYRRTAMADTHHNASLDRIELLAPLPPEERAALARQCSWRHFRPHEQIIDRASDSRDVCFIVEGRVRVVNYSLSGREITFDDVGAGGYLGELAAIDGEPRSASIVALTEVMVAFMAPRLFQETVTRHPELAMFVMRRLTRIVRASTGRIMDLSTLGANNRVHAELLRLGKDTLRDDNTAAITPVPIHSDIASRVSTTRETVARVLSDLARDGLVERRGNSLVILDFERLEGMVEEVRGD